MLNVRLDKELEDFLNQYSENNQVSKSSIVKEALALYFKQKKVSKKPYDLGKEFFGKFGSGESNRSTTYKQRIKKKVGEKHSH